MSFSLTFEEFMRYKESNKDILPELRSQANSMNFKVRNRGRSGNLKRDDKQQINLWIINNKLNKSEDEKMYSDMRGMLNKLSENNFEDIANDIINLDIKNGEHLSTLANTIFKKAISEKKYSKIYAILCTRLSSHCVYLDDGKKVYFKELLLNKCQNTFQEIVSFDMGIENNEDGSILKLKSYILGSITYIGELYNQGLITNKIINSCFVVLLAKTKLKKAYIINSMCTLMTIVGPKFCKESKNNTKKWFDIFQKLQDDENIEIKENFYLMDLIDLKNREKWIK
jgi:hypothetical protein